MLLFTLFCEAESEKTVHGPGPTLLSSSLIPNSPQVLNRLLYFATMIADTSVVLLFRCKHLVKDLFKYFIKQWGSSGPIGTSST